MNDPGFDAFRDQWLEEVKQFVPSVGLSEDVLGQAFGCVAAVGFLNGLKHQIGYNVHVRGAVITPAPTLVAPPERRAGDRRYSSLRQYPANGCRNPRR